MTVLYQRVMDLPSRRVIDPLRTRWPGISGAIFQINNHTWGVLIVSTEAGVIFSEVAVAVDELFNGLDLAGFIKNRRVMDGFYKFELVEPLSGWTPTHVEAL